VPHRRRHRPRHPARPRHTARTTAAPPQPRRPRSEARLAPAGRRLATTHASGRGSPPTLSDRVEIWRAQDRVVPGHKVKGPRRDTSGGGSEGRRSRSSAASATGGVVRRIVSGASRWDVLMRTRISQLCPARPIGYVPCEEDDATETPAHSAGAPHVLAEPDRPLRACQAPCGACPPRSAGLRSCLSCSWERRGQWPQAPEGPVKGVGRVGGCPAGGRSGEPIDMGPPPATGSSRPARTASPADSRSTAAGCAGGRTGRPGSA